MRPIPLRDHQCGTQRQGTPLIRAIDAKKRETREFFGVTEGGERADVAVLEEGKIRNEDSEGDAPGGINPRRKRTKQHLARDAARREEDRQFCHRYPISPCNHNSQKRRAPRWKHGQLRGCEPDVDTINDGALV